MCRPYQISLQSIVFIAIIILIIIIIITNVVIIFNKPALINKNTHIVMAISDHSQEIGRSVEINALRHSHQTQPL